MALYLVQHGKSLPKERDPDQGLSETGIEETRRIAQVAAGYHVSVGRIHHSGKKRACQTAELFSEHLTPEHGIRQIDGIKPLDDVIDLAPDLDPGANLMLVGHLPFMARLAAYLITGKIEPPVFKFQNSGIVCLDKPPQNGGWVIVWTLMPHIGQ
ncbi:MAG: phosphohistidine phosphatase SixA [Desulfosarcinaceae bacterium]